MAVGRSHGLRALRGALSGIALVGVGIAAAPPAVAAEPAAGGTQVLAGGPDGPVSNYGMCWITKSCVGGDH